MFSPSTHLLMCLSLFNVHHKDWLTYSGGTDRHWWTLVIFFISNDLTELVDFPTRIAECDSHSPALLDLFFSCDASICSAMAFPPLKNSDHVVVSCCQFPLTFCKTQNGISRFSE